MERTNNPAGDPGQDRVEDHVFTTMADETPRREGGDDALAETDPQDGRADEKVIVNEQREQKIVNTPDQSAPSTSEGISNEEDTIDSTSNEDGNARE